MEGWTGRRAFVGSKHGGLGGLKNANAANMSTPKRGGEVFRYQDFVGSLMGGGFGAEDHHQGGAGEVVRT